MVVGGHLHHIEGGGGVLVVVVVFDKAAPLELSVACSAAKKWP